MARPGSGRVSFRGLPAALADITKKAGKFVRQRHSRILCRTGRLRSQFRTTGVRRDKCARPVWHIRENVSVDKNDAAQGPQEALCQKLFSNPREFLPYRIDRHYLFRP